MISIDWKRNNLCLGNYLYEPLNIEGKTLLRWEGDCATKETDEVFSNRINRNYGDNWEGRRKEKKIWLRADPMDLENRM